MDRTDKWKCIESLMALSAQLQREIDEIKSKKKTSKRISNAELREALTSGIAQLQREIDEIKSSQE